MSLYLSDFNTLTNLVRMIYFRRNSNSHRGSRRHHPGKRSAHCCRDRSTESEISAGIPTHNVAVYVATIARIARIVVVVVGVRRAPPVGTPIHTAIVDVAITVYITHTAGAVEVRRAFINILI